VLTLRPLHLVLLGPLWIGSGLVALNVFLKLVDQRWLAASWITPVLALCLGLCLRELLPQDPGAPRRRLRRGG
jgi:hypothetical protein